MLLKCLLFLTVIEIIVCVEVVSYKNYKLYNVIAKNQNQFNYLHNISMSRINNGIDFLDFGNERVIVSPDECKHFEKLLQDDQIEFKVLDTDLSKSIETERKDNSWFANVKLRSSAKIGFQRYYSVDEINEYLDSLATSYPQTVKVQTAGKSYEKRVIKAIIISNDIINSDKKIVILDAGIHAREWISPATALYVIYQLVEHFTVNKNLLQNTDFVILPLLNPDGYEYSHSYNRLWRKTRKPNRRCRGADANRNFGYHWGELGVSSNECDHTYPGAKAFSESESRALRDVLHSFGSRTKMYLSLHSCGSYILYPWGWKKARPDSWNDIDEIARAGSEAILKANKAVSFKCGSQSDLLYAATGNTHDYALGVIKIPISMTMELPCAGSGYGFHPHPSQIEAVTKAIWPGFKAMIKKLDEKF